MLLRYFYDPALAHASYLVGCQRTGEALVVDPGRDVTSYLQSAKAAGMRIVVSAETHIHADFVSGSRELADRVGARLYVSDEGPADWKYQFLDRHDATLLKDGDRFRVGRVRLDVWHTPGHTPESISFLLTDEGSGATVPMGIFTGDFVFVGSIGRPDLLETAAGVTGSAEVGARQLYQSMRRFLTLPDHLQVWPAHGAGSACGKGLGAVPSSTVGYERLANPALQYQDENAFVDYILSDQPETPSYFGVMKRVNKHGPALLRDLPSVPKLEANAARSVANESLVLDTSPRDDFATSFVPGSINIPSSALAQWAGYFVDYEQPVYLITQVQDLESNLRALRSIGVDRVAGYFDLAETLLERVRSDSYVSLSPQELSSRIERDGMAIIDVRAYTEFTDGHLPAARHQFLGTLLRTPELVPSHIPLAIYCQSGARSAIAMSILKRAGRNAFNLRGGVNAWRQAGLPMESTASAVLPA